MLSDKKGQHMMGLPFVFIISMVIAAVIVISAVYTIKNFSCRGEQVEINLFVNELRNEIEKSFYTTPDSQTVFDGTLPKGCADIQLVCFAFPDQPKTTQIAADIWEEISLFRGEGKQLFLYPRSGLAEVGVSQSHNIEPEGVNIELTRNPTCFQNTGKIRIFIKNQGDNVLIKNVE